MKVLLLSRYGRLGASSRIRSYQYLPFLSKGGIHVTVAPLFCDEYVKGLYDGRISLLLVLQSYAMRIVNMLRCYKFDLVWTEKELLPWIPSWLELFIFPSTVPLLVDYDDAIYHRYDQHKSHLIKFFLGEKIDSIMSRSALVIAGNAYIATHARKAGAKRVEILPSAVDPEKYTYTRASLHRKLTIGWIGSPATAKFLKIVFSTLKNIMSLHQVRIVFVGAKKNQIEDFPAEIREWSEEREVEEIQNFDIGIMPLPNEPFERGKCGYKIIQYMACGRAVIASAVGANNEILEHGVNGFLANSDDDWFYYLKKLIENCDLRQQMGLEGRKRFEEKYSTKPIGNILMTLIKSVGRNSRGS